MNDKPHGDLIGYARTSTLEQEAGLDAQLAELKALKCRRVFKEQVSSVDIVRRVQLEAAIEFLREGDVLVETKLDRLARSIRDLVASSTESRPRAPRFAFSAWASTLRRPMAG